MKLFLGGDLMLGRGIDQILPYPADPILYEPWVRDARDYVLLAEQRNGPIPRAVAPTYPWGAALEALEAEEPAVRIVNLETSLTDRGAPDPSKGIHYRMAPANRAVLAAARLDVCALANNHVLDWGPIGLSDTLETLASLQIEAVGAGGDAMTARMPASIYRPGVGRVRVVSVADGSSGVPEHWEATAARPGVWRLPDLSVETAIQVAAHACRDRLEGEVVVVSIHWGPNWGWAPSADERRFAHQLIEGGVDLIHGHSSHHVRPIEVYRDRLVLYGCGELIDDYEGIGGYEAFRPDLVLLWFPTLGSDGVLQGLRAIPMQLQRLQLVPPSEEDRAWLLSALAQLCRPFGLEVRSDAGQALVFS